ncbi:proline-rich protein 7 isoform 1-T1 [Guaruba guarouba]
MLPAAAGETAAGGAAAGAEPTCAGAGAAALRGLRGQPPRHRHSPPPAPRAPPSSPPPHPSPSALELPARVRPVKAAVLRGSAADGRAPPTIQRGADGHTGALPQNQRPVPEPRAAGEAGAAPQLQTPFPGRRLRLRTAPAPLGQPRPCLPGPLPAGRVLPSHVSQLDGLGAQQQGHLRAGTLAPPGLHAPLRQDYRCLTAAPGDPRTLLRVPLRHWRRRGDGNSGSVDPIVPGTPAPARAIAAGAEGAGSPPGPRWPPPGRGLWGPGPCSCFLTFAFVTV